MTIVRKCEISDLEQMVEMAFQKNNESSHFSAFCPRLRNSIQKEFEDGLNSSDHLYIGYYENDLLKGMIGGYLDPERNNVDCCGPFIDGDFIKIANEMFDFMRTYYEVSTEFTFYFGRKNTDCISYMERIKAENQGNEYQLKLHKKDDRALETTMSVVPLPDTYFEQLIQLHNTIFPDVYISGQGIIQSIGINRQVFCVVKDTRLIGYGVLKTYGNTSKATVEVLAVNEFDRHRGYGRELLKHLIKIAFQDASIDYIDLIVETRNENALELYYSMGFQLLQENCCYIAFGK